MADTFPIMTFDTPVVPFLPGTVGVGVIDLRSLASELSPRVTDPFVETVDGDATRPPTAQVTDGPHRYTIVVPNQGENSWLNLGQADPNRINDTGLTGQSKTHLHLHKFEAPQTMGSEVSCGSAPWPPTPLTVMRASSTAAMIGPSRSAN